MRQCGIGGTGLDHCLLLISGVKGCQGCAFDREGEILESYITKKRDKAALLTFMKETLKRHGRANQIVTDGLRSYPAAMRKLGRSEERR